MDRPHLGGSNPASFTGFRSSGRAPSWCVDTCHVLHRSTDLIALLSLALPSLAAAQPKADRSYEKMVAKVAGMIDNERAYTLAPAQNLQRDFPGLVERFAMGLMIRRRLTAL